MSLDWNLSKVQDQTVCWRVAEKDDVGRGEQKGESYMTGLANAMIWATMAVDIGKITDENAAEFHRRLDVLFDAGHPLMQKYVEGEGFQPYRVTLDDVKSLVGLRTNVSNMTAKQWDAKRRKIAKQDAERAARYAK